MSERARYIFGTITIGSVIAFAVYSIYEYKKLSKEQEGAITIDQAQKEIEDYENQEIEERYENGKADGFREKMVEISPEEYENPREITEEDHILRHDPNSDRAREQFIAMNLAEWEPGSETHTVLSTLFMFPFAPTNDGDRLLRHQIIEDRKDFFGKDSIWNTRVTYADVILHFASRTVFHFDRTIDIWVRLFLENIGIHSMMSSQSIEKTLDDLNKHQFFNQETGGFGLFGLDPDQLDEVYSTADKQVDPDITYELQYNEFLMGVE